MFLSIYIVLSIIVFIITLRVYSKNELFFDEENDLDPFWIFSLICITLASPLVLLGYFIIIFIKLIGFLIKVFINYIKQFKIIKFVFGKIITIVDKVILFLGLDNY